MSSPTKGFLLRKTPFPGGDPAKDPVDLKIRESTIEHMVVSLRKAGANPQEVSNYIRQMKSAKTMTQLNQYQTDWYEFLMDKIRGGHSDDEYEMQQEIEETSEKLELMGIPAKDYDKFHGEVSKAETLKEVDRICGKWLNAYFNRAKKKGS